MGSSIVKHAALEAKTKLGWDRSRTGKNGIEILWQRYYDKVMFNIGGNDSYESAAGVKIRFGMNNVLFIWTLFFIVVHF